MLVKMLKIMDDPLTCGTMNLATIEGNVWKYPRYLSQYFDTLNGDYCEGVKLPLFGSSGKLKKTKKTYTWVTST